MEPQYYYRIADLDGNIRAEGRASLPLITRVLSEVVEDGTRTADITLMGGGREEYAIQIRRVQ